MLSFLVPFEEIKTQNEVRQYDFAYVNLLYWLCESVFLCVCN